MTRDKSSSAPELERLIEQAKSVRPLSQATRGRVLRRAQSSTLLGASIVTSKAPWPRTGPATVTWLGAAAVAVGLAGAGVALYAQKRQVTVIGHVTSIASSDVAIASQVEQGPVPSASGALPESAAPAASAAETAHVPRPAPILESYGAELALLRRAHSAYGSHDFSTALRLLAEHGRRFPNGRLAEEREALRVRALSGLGLNEAARLAAREFAVRFPRSVLLSRTIAAAGAGE
jgi:TolA-binding protein